MSILSSTNSGLRSEKLVLTDFKEDKDFVISEYKENTNSLPILFIDSYKDKSCRVVASPRSDEINPDFIFFFRFDSSIFDSVKQYTFPNFKIKSIIINSKYHLSLVKQYINTPYIEQKKKILQKLQEK